MFVKALTASIESTTYLIIFGSALSSPHCAFFGMDAARLRPPAGVSDRVWQNKQIHIFDKLIESVARNQYPETAPLLQISGVGPITAVQYVLTIGDPTRFEHSRDVGAYLGLTPQRRQSGDIDQQLRIGKAGNRRLRSLLVQCAQYLLVRFGPDADRKRWGARMAERSEKNAHKRAIVARNLNRTDRVRMVCFEIRRRIESEGQQPVAVVMMSACRPKSWLP